MLSLSNLTKSFGDKIIFDGFSYVFSDTGLYLIKGDSGIGKTTLLRIIAGLDNAYTGEVMNGGLGKVSFMFQEYRLFPTISALENVILGSQDADNARKIALEYLSLLGLTAADAQKKPSQLSGGMKQRVAFARALMMNAPILILDEPTKELDEASVSKMIQLISSESKKRLVIMVTHDANANFEENATVINL